MGEKKKEEKIRKILVEITKLGPIEFIGICEVLGVKVLEKDENGEEKDRKFEEVWEEVVQKISELNRVRRRNLEKLVRAAVRAR